jgi:hypothetical protein
MLFGLALPPVACLSCFSCRLGVMTGLTCTNCVVESVGAAEVDGCRMVNLIGSDKAALSFDLALIRVAL